MPVTYKYCLVAGISEIVVVVLRGGGEPWIAFSAICTPLQGRSAPF